MRRTMSSAACDAWNFTISRPPMNRNVRTRLPAADDAAMHTMPTAFRGTASGPAMPSHHADIHARARSNPVALLRHRLADRAVRPSASPRHPSNSVFAALL